MYSSGNAFLTSVDLCLIECLYWQAGPGEVAADDRQLLPEERQLPAGPGDV